MKFAMIIDAVGGDMKSYQVRDGIGYDFNNKPNYTSQKKMLPLYMHS